jgi:hypothetical protein
MSDKKKDELLHDHNNDGVNRRGFLKCMAWAGTGAFCVMQGGVLKSYSLSRLSPLNAAEAAGDLSFVQISDSPMGFNKPANPDVAGTLKAAVDKINGLTAAPEFMLHTGDISHLSNPEEFDTVDQILKSAKPKDVFYVPGGHDVLNDDGKQFLERYGKGSKGAGWYSFDKKGTHFIGLVNGMNLKAGAGTRTAGVDRSRRQAPEVEHAHRGVRAHSAVERLSGVGLGHGRQCTGAGISEEIRFSDGAERAHPPDHAESGRQRHISHRGFDSVSTTTAWESGFAWADEGSGGPVAECLGHY